jgi:hypothetical protein
MKCWYPNADHVNVTYRGTPEGSPGRRFLVDLHVVLGTKESINHELEAEFAVGESVLRSVAPARNVFQRLQFHASER